MEAVIDLSWLYCGLRRLVVRNNHTTYKSNPSLQIYPPFLLTTANHIYINYFNIVICAILILLSESPTRLLLYYYDIAYIIPNSHIFVFTFTSFLNN